MRHTMLALAVLAISAALTVAVSYRLVRRTLVVVRISGHSMLPAYRPGDAVLVRRASGAAMRTGDVVVFTSAGTTGRNDGLSVWATVMEPGGEWLIKRVAAVAGDPAPRELRRPADEPVPGGHLAVLGDNRPFSHDSRHFGYVDNRSVLGVVAFRLTRAPAMTYPSQLTSAYQDVPPKGVVAMDDQGQQHEGPR